MRTGRPRLVPGTAKAAMLTLRLKPEEKAQLEKAAAKKGEKVSDWARNILLLAAKSDRSV